MVTVNAKTLAKAVKSMKSAWNWSYVFDKHLLFETNCGKIRLSTTAINNVSYTAAVELDGIDSCDTFEMMVDAKELLDALRNVKTNDLVSLDASGLLVRGSLQAKIGVKELDSMYPRVFDKHFLRISSDLIGTVADIDRFSWIAGAMSTDDTRPNLNAICIDGSRAIATDGHRLHVDFEVMQMCKDIGDNIMVHRMAIESALLFKPVSLAVVRNSKYIGLVATDSDGAVLTSYTVCDLGCYPDYKQVMPSEKDRRDIVTVNGKKLAEVCKAVRSFGEKKSENGCIFTMNGRIDCKCGEKEASLEYHARESNQDIKVCFNPRYIAEACNVDGLVHFMIPENELSAAALSTGYRTAVVMPVRF